MSVTRCATTELGRANPHNKTGIRGTLILLVLLVAPAGQSLVAQNNRNGRIAAADTVFGANPRLVRDLLSIALNPAAGPLDSIWFHGVQMLAQTLADERQPALAAVWLRWALRLRPGMPIDTLNFTLDTIATAARQLVRASTGDSLTQTNWEWPVAPPNEMGQLRVAPSTLPGFQVVVRGNRVRSGDVLNLPAGTYDLQAVADGHVTTRVTREVLPGVTTVVAFSLRPITRIAAAPDTTRRAAAAPPAPRIAAGGEGAKKPDTTPPNIRKGKSRLPFILAGAGGAGVAAVLLLRPRTAENGTITLDFEDPTRQ